MLHLSGHFEFIRSFAVRTIQHGEYFVDTCAHVQSRSPILLENIGADVSIVTFDLRVVDRREEVNFWRLEGILFREFEFESKAAAKVWSVLGTDDRYYSMQEIVFFSLYHCIVRRVLSEILELFRNSILNCLSYFIMIPI